MEPIAITGFSFKFAQDVDDVDSLWNVLENAKSLMTDWPKSRGNSDSFYEHVEDVTDANKNTLYTKGGHFINEDPAVFDAPFFSITAHDAASMDPQQRWLLEATYRALENAGMPVEKAAGTDTSVFAASPGDEYTRLVSKDPDDAHQNVALGATGSIIANRISWYFDLRGPSMQVNTACSTSMIAMDLACQSLRIGQSSAALVAGANVFLSPEPSIFLSNMKMLSPDGLSYSFDHRANGYSRGEGIAVVVLKRLSDAIRDGDMIRSVIRGTGSNQDGYTPGILLPNPESQEKLIRRVYRDAKLDFELTRYFEAHGTGTKAGDSAEVKALGRVFKTSRSPTQPLYVGSIKPNVGHTEPTSALAGILKCIMILEKGVIPPNALFEKLNPSVKAKTYNIEIPTKSIPWPSEGLRRVSINSFGFGGSNGHIIMDDAYNTLKTLAVSEQSKSLLCVVPVTQTDVPTSSGSSVGTTNGTNGTRGRHTENRLGGANASTAVEQNDTTTGDDIQAIEPFPGQLPNDMANGSGNPLSADSTHVNGESAHTATEKGASAHPLINGTGKTSAGARTSSPMLLTWSARDEHALKRMIQDQSNYYKQHICGSKDSLESFAYTLAARRSLMTWKACAVVDANDQSITATPVRSLRETTMAFVFTGQGAQYVNMGLELLQYAVFKSCIETCDSFLTSFGASWSVVEKLGDKASIDNAEYSQPLCTILQLALVELLRSFNVLPSIVVGHSSGEIAAAYTGGALSLEGACKVAYHRGRLAAKLLASTTTPGAMMSVELEEQSVPTYLEKVPQLASSRNIHVACVNSPTNVTLSGLETDIDVFKAYLDKEEIFARKVNTGVAYHSPAMAEIADEYLSSLEDLPMFADSGSAVPIISSVLGERVSPATMADGQYWVDNLLSPVRFADALKYVEVMAPTVDGIKQVTDYLEIGPHAALKRPISTTLAQSSGRNGDNHYASVLSKFESPLRSILQVTGRLFSRGYPVSVLAANQGTGKPRPFLVDLPEYPFDRSKTYWSESRLSRDWRLREAVHVSLLGQRASDWTPLEPRWRKLLSFKTTPWVADHVVNDTVYFPGIGSILMAIEAVRQVTQDLENVVGYRVKEAMLTSPIVVKQDSQTELVTRLRPVQQAYEKTSTRFQVQITTYMDETWQECLNAEIEVQASTMTEVDGGLEARASTESFARKYNDAKALCTNHIAKEDFYKWHKESGIKYGPSFARVDDIFWDGDAMSITRINVAPPVEAFESLVHPGILDSAFQVCFTGPSKGMTERLPTIIPNKFSDLWISATGWQFPQTTAIRMMTSSRLKETGAGIESSFVVLADDDTTLLHVEQVNLQRVLGDTFSDNNDRNLLHSISWKPQLSELQPEVLQRICRHQIDLQDETTRVESIVKLEQLLRAVLKRTITSSGKVDSSNLPLALQKYILWAQNKIQNVSEELLDGLSDVTIQAELEELAQQTPAWTPFVDTALSIQNIIRGEKDVSTIPMTFEKFHDESMRQLFNSETQAYLELRVHERPTQKILEVSRGNVAMATHVLPILQGIEQRAGGVSFSEYTLTNPSKDTLEEVQARLAHYGDRLTIRSLKLEEDITTQGFDIGTYDTVLASNTVLVGKDLSATLAKLRSMLKPGGHLILHEMTASQNFALNFGFGILPNWWHDEQQSQSHNVILPVAQWEMALKDAGFSGNDLIVRDCRNDDAHLCSLIFSTASGDADSSPAKHSRSIILVQEGSQYQQKIASNLAEKLSAVGAQHDIVQVSLSATDIHLAPGDCAIILADMGSPFLARFSSMEFTSLKRWIQRASNILWVTSPPTTANETEPEAGLPYVGLKDGFLRVLRQEASMKKIVSLTIEDQLSKNDIVDYITKVLKLGFGGAESENEFVIREGNISTGRLVQKGELDKALHATFAPQLRKEPWKPGPPLRLDIANRGSLETLRFVEDFDRQKALGPADVEIEAAVWGLNFRDLFQALGRLDETEFGLDCSGIVTRVGSEVTTIQPGNRVVMMEMDCHRMYPRANEKAVVRIPDLVSFEDACAILAPAVTAWHSLVDVGRLQAGEKVLIHAASGATGQLAVQIAKLLGAEVFATVGFDYKKQLLIDQYDIPADHIFYSRNTSFAKGIMRVTNGYGVDVVLNSLVGEGLRASWECMAPYGRFVEIGKADINANSPLSMKHFAANVSFHAVDLRHASLYRKDIGWKLMQRAMQLLTDGLISCPHPRNVFGISQVEDAFRFMQSGKNTGRIVIKIDPSTVVKKHLMLLQDWHFDENATYIVCGGLGGIGRSILHWMVSKGAKNLLVLSRSGPKSDAAKDLVDGLSKRGINILTPKCDVAAESSLIAVLAEAAKTMPRVRGCINAAMDIHDSIFDNMSHAQWEAAMRSKVQTTWNLHKHSPQDLDFFILLSSVSGVLGNPGQANYAAGCTFQDAVARYRVQNGQRGLSIDLGVMRGIGFVAEKEDLQAHYLDAHQIAQIEEKELLALLELCCNPTSPLPPDQSQITVGLNTNLASLAQDAEEVGKKPLYRRFSLARDALSSASSDEREVNYTALFRTAGGSTQARAAVVEEFLRTKLARALSVPIEEVDTDRPLHAYGVDSLVAVELRNWIAKYFAADVPIAKIIGSQTIISVALLVSKVSQIV